MTDDDDGKHVDGGDDGDSGESGAHPHPTENPAQVPSWFGSGDGPGSLPVSERTVTSVGVDGWTCTCQGGAGDARGCRSKGIADDIDIDVGVNVDVNVDVKVDLDADADANITGNVGDTGESGMEGADICVIFVTQVAPCCRMSGVGGGEGGEGGGGNGCILVTADVASRTGADDDNVGEEEVQGEEDIIVDEGGRAGGA
ncbi:hypothetical protein BGZ94_004088 [Podila epigama]|nr:hypothetical protein BGZ94_004088 [Podila epigama]